MLLDPGIVISAGGGFEAYIGPYGTTYVREVASGVAGDPPFRVLQTSFVSTLSTDHGWERLFAEARIGSRFLQVPIVPDAFPGSIVVNPGSAAEFVRYRAPARFCYRVMNGRLTFAGERVAGTEVTMARHKVTDIVRAFLESAEAAVVSKPTELSRAARRLLGLSGALAAGAVLCVVGLTAFLPR